MNVYEAIHREHTELFKLLRKLEDTTTGRPDDRRRIRDQVARRMEAIARAEDRQVYARLVQEPSLRAVVSDLREDQARALALLHALSEIDPEDKKFQHTAEALYAQARIHFEREDRELLVPLQKVIDDEEAELMGERFELEKDRAIAEMRP